jgi:hypothetical protein
VCDRLAVISRSDIYVILLKLCDTRRPTMGLHKQYLKVGQSAKNRLFGVKPWKKIPGNAEGTSSIQMLISEQGKINHGE